MFCVIKLTCETIASSNSPNNRYTEHQIRISPLFQNAYACGKLGICGKIEVVEASNEVLEVCVHAVVGAEAKNSLTSWLVPCQHEA